MLLQEPLLVVGAFYLLFVLVIIYVRLDFSITKVNFLQFGFIDHIWFKIEGKFLYSFLPKDEASESRMRVASLIEQVQGAQDRRSALYQSYEDAVNKFKSSKDANSFAAQRKKIDHDHKQLTQEIANLQAKLKSEGVDASEKV